MNTTSAILEIGQWLVGVTGLAVAAIALRYSARANRIARESNLIAATANSLSMEANTIATKAIDIEKGRDETRVRLSDLYCRDPSGSSLLLGFTVTNNSDFAVTVSKCWVDAENGNAMSCPISWMMKSSTRIESRANNSFKVALSIKDAQRMLIGSTITHLRVELEHGPCITAPLGATHIEKKIEQHLLAD